jgi:hypothetical protein
MAQNYKGPLDYIDVATRIVEFREKFPEGSLQQVKYEFVTVNNKDWVVYTAAAYRSPDDQRPGIGTAWEPIPGPTNFTRDSEVQNAETAAWGRAMVAALAVDTKKGIASSEEVRNRQTKSTATAKDWLAMATELGNDIEGLRLLYSQAKTANATAATLNKIQELATANGQTSEQDTPMLNS